MVLFRTKYNFQIITATLQMSNWSKTDGRSVQNPEFPGLKGKKEQ